MRQKKKDAGLQSTDARPGQDFEAELINSRVRAGGKEEPDRNMHAGESCSKRRQKTQLPAERWEKLGSARRRRDKGAKGPGR